MFPWALRRDVAILIGIKVCALALLYVVFFSPADRAPQSATSMRAHLIENRAP